jgi:hypothetical protein
LAYYQVVMAARTQLYELALLAALAVVIAILLI